jgi:hypothetical protein
MPDIAKERADLEKAEKDIRVGEARIAQQLRLIDELRRDGHHVADAEKLLSAMEHALNVWKDHRDTIRSILETSEKRATARKPE